MIPPPAAAVPGVVAHRGDALRYPENTLPALAAALEAGARYIEFDVQLSADAVPFLLHDADLRRTAGLDRAAASLTAAQLRLLEVRTWPRLGDRVRGVRVPALSDVVPLLRGWPDARAFVELKPAGLAQLGADALVDRTLAALAPVAAQCIVISEDLAAVEAARSAGAAAVGWVTHAWDPAAQRTAESLAPDYLFCDHRRIPPPPVPLWPGPWRWVVYEVTDPAQALALAARGVPLVETMAVLEMLDALGPSGAG